MADTYQNHLRGFYDYIQKSGGMRYKHQFLVHINFSEIQNAAYVNRGIQRDYFNNMYGDTWVDYLRKAGEDAKGSIGNKPTHDLTFFANSTSIPETTLKTTDVSFLAAGFKFPGVMDYANTWSINILLDQNLYVYTELLYWKELMSSYARNNGGNKTIPNVDGDVWLLDQYMQQAQRRFKMRGIFIKEIPQIQMEYKEGSSDKIEVGCNFAMQWFEEVDVNNGQPLEFDGMGI